MGKENDGQICNLKVSELKELINLVLEDNLKKLPIKETREILNKKLLTLKEITQIFKITKQTAYKWIKCDVLPKPMKVGGRVYFKKSQIDEIINQNSLENEK